MRIGEVATQSGFPMETLRYYEKRGLLEPISRTESGYREYDEKSLKQLNFIRQAKSVGFSLDEISELLTLRVARDQHSCADVKLIAESKLDKIELKINELKRIQKALHEITAACCGGSESAVSCTILDSLDGSVEVLDNESVKRPVNNQHGVKCHD